MAGSCTAFSIAVLYIVGRPKEFSGKSCNSKGRKLYKVRDLPKAVDLKNSSRVVRVPQTSLIFLTMGLVSASGITARMYFKPILEALA